MRRLIIALAFLLAPTLAQGETCTFPVGTTAWTSISQDFDATCTESNGDDFVVPSGATVTIAVGQTVTGASGSSVTVQTGGVLNVIGTLTIGDLKETGGTITVAPATSAASGIVNLINCGSASILDAAFPCGGETGTINLQGAVIHDSVTNGALWQDFEADYTNRDTMKLRFSAALAATPVAGDLLWIKSGVDRGAVYEVSAVGAFSSCPSNCTVTIRLYDADMEYKNATATYSEWDSASTKVIYADNASTTAEQVKTPDPAATTFATYQNDRMVALCHDLGANNWVTSNTCGADSTVIAESGAFTGWYAAFKNASAFTTPWGASDLGNERYLIVNSLNNVAGDTYFGASFPSTPLVDILILADAPSPERWVNPYSGAHQLARMVVWPGFWNTDDWVLIRPAKVQYTGTDANAGFLMGGTTDVDGAFFEDWWVVSVENSSGLNTTNPANYMLVVPWQDGSTAAINYNAEDFGGNCENIAMQVRDFTTPVSMSYIAVADSRTDLDVSDTCCVEFNRGGAACGAGGAGYLTANHPDFGGPDTGVPAGTGVADPTSGTHGLRVEDVADGTFENVYARYLADDALLINNGGLAQDSTIRFPGLHAWWMRQGSSGNLLDGTTHTDYSTTVTISDFRNSAYVAGKSTACSSQGGGITFAACPSCTTPTEDNATVYLQNGVYLDPFAQQSITNGSTDGDYITHISNVYAYGRDQESTNTACYIADVNATITNSFIDGWSALSGSASISSVERTFWRADSTAPAAAIHQSPSNNTTSIVDNVFTNLGAQNFSGGFSSTYATTIRNNVMRWAAAANGYTFGALSAGNVAPTILYNIVEGRNLLNCGTSDVSGTNIYENWIVGPTSGTNSLVNNYTRCPGIGSTRYTSPVSGIPFGALGLSGASRVGPRTQVGVTADLSRFGLRSRELTKLGGGAGGIIPRAF